MLSMVVCLLIGVALAAGCAAPARVVDPMAVERPKIRVVMDRGGRVLDPPLEVDLGRPSEGRTYPRIARIVEPAESRFNVARVFVG